MSETWRTHPAQPRIAPTYSGPDLNAPFARAAGGQHSEEHPVHARIQWETYDGTHYEELVWGLVTAWTDHAFRVHFWRHGENWEWLPRDAVQPCTCTQRHDPGWWPAT